MISFIGNAGDFLKIGVKAAERGQLEAVKEILAKRPSWVSKVGSHGRTMLWGACHKGRLAVVKYLVQQGADIQACGGHYTPYFVELSCLAIALHKQHHAVAEWLKEHGARLDIHQAAFLGQIELVRQLLSQSPQHLDLGHPQHIMAPKQVKGMDFMPAAAPWATPLCYALRGGDLTTVKFLLQAGATVEPHSKKLFIAADDQPVLDQLLLEHGADAQHAPKALPGDAMYPVVSAFAVAPPSSAALSAELVYLCRGDRGGQVEEVERLLQHGADINFQDHKGKAALHRAAKAGFILTIAFLLKNGANVELEDRAGETPIFEPVRSTIKDQRKRIKALELLLEAGANRNHRNKKGDRVIDVLRRSRDSRKEGLIKVLRAKK